ncbi:MAG: methyltransferase domain-containing protein [Chloroflexi bacterium]|nr:MAG: methyltransferase domain-containing protein [Chloroflexota bacterium]
MGRERLTYFAQTVPGVEEIAWLELRARLPNVKFERYLYAADTHGIVSFTFEGDPATLTDLWTVEDVFWQALMRKLERTRRDLVDIGRWLQAEESVGRAAHALMRYRKFARPPVYRLRVRQFGQHVYDKRQLESAVSRALKKRLFPWLPCPPDQKPDVEIQADLLGSWFLCGFRLTPVPDRNKKRALRQADIRPSLAAAMAFLSQPTPDDVFLDPFCGQGYVLRWRQQMGRFYRLLGGDNVSTAVLQRSQRALRRRFNPLPSICQWQANQLPLATASVNVVAGRLPSKTAVACTASLSELARVVMPGGRLVLLCRDYELVKECIRQVPELQIQTGYSVKDGNKWGRIYILHRQSS